MSTTSAMATSSSDGTVPVSARVIGTYQGTRSAIIFVKMYRDGDLLKLNCQMNGIPYEEAPTIADLHAKLVSDKNAVGFIHVHDLRVAKHLRSDPVLAKTPLVILNSEWKTGEAQIREANLGPVCVLEVPFYVGNVLSAMNTVF
jgi:hypothetical protein